MNNFLIITLDETEYAFRLEKVHRVIPLVKLIQIPTAPAFFSGLINLEGNVIPVLNLYGIFKLQQPKVNLSQKLIIMNDEGSSFAILVDEVKNIVETTEKNVVDPEKIFKGLGHLLEKVIQLNDDTVPVFEFKKLLNELELSLIEEIVNKETAK